MVHVQPRAKRSEVVGRHGDAIKVRLTAGLTSRRKTVEIEGLTGAAAEALLG